MIANYPKFQKIIVFLLILLLAVVSYFGVLYFKKTQRLKKEVQRLENLITPAPRAPLTLPESRFEGNDGTKDPKEGNLGQVKLVLDLEKSPPQLSWPAEFEIKALRLYFLGQTEETYDNFLIWSFKVLNSPQVITIEDGKLKKEPALRFTPPLVLGEWRPLMEVEISLLANFSSPQNQRFAIEAYFQKEGDDKLYKGILGFSY